MPLDVSVRGALLRAARESIGRHFTGDSAVPEAGVDDPVLSEPRATFVTLKLDHRLRGCIGVLEPARPLLLDVVHNARAAAFRDPRFPPLGRAELGPLRIEISVLSPSEPLTAADRGALLRALLPGRDGLILREGRHHATFLPAVWESLPEPAVFLAELLAKAGLAPDHWSDRLRFWRYTTESFGETA
jgi:hypothetical protein